MANEELRQRIDGMTVSERRVRLTTIKKLGAAGKYAEYDFDEYVLLCQSIPEESAAMHRAFVARRRRTLRRTR